MSTTQQCRPSLSEAAEEAALSPDSHWTATLSQIGMTRISRRAVLGAWAPEVPR
jgi:hypothetical protein